MTINDNPISQYFESVISAVYSAKQNPKGIPPHSEFLGHPLTIVTAVTTLPDQNLGAFAFDLYDSIQSLPPVLVASSDLSKIFREGVKWLEEKFPNERMVIFIPLPRLEDLNLPDNDLIQYGIAPEDDPEIDALRSRANRHLDRYLLHCRGENVEIKLPSRPLMGQDHEAWYIDCLNKCEAAGLDEKEANHEIIKELFRPLTEAEIVSIHQKYPNGLSADLVQLLTEEEVDDLAQRILDKTARKPSGTALDAGSGNAAS